MADGRRLGLNLGCDDNLENTATTEFENDDGLEKTSMTKTTKLRRRRLDDYDVRKRHGLRVKTFHTNIRKWRCLCDSSPKDEPLNDSHDSHPSSLNITFLHTLDMRQKKRKVCALLKSIEYVAFSSEDMISFALRISSVVECCPGCEKFRLLSSHRLVFVSSLSSHPRNRFVSHPGSAPSMKG